MHGRNYLIQFFVFMYGERSLAQLICVFIIEACWFIWLYKARWLQVQRENYFELTNIGLNLLYIVLKAITILEMSNHSRQFVIGTIMAIILLVKVALCIVRAIVYT